MVFDLREAPIGLQSLSCLQLFVIVKIVQRSFAPSFVSSREVDKEGTVVERRFGILESELSNYESLVGQQR